MQHAVLLAAIVISLAPSAARIPHAVLAGILLEAGYDILDAGYRKHSHERPRWDLVLMVTVPGLVVFADPVTAVAVGAVLAAGAFVKQLADEQLKQFSGEAKI